MALVSLFCDGLKFDGWHLCFRLECRQRVLYLNGAFKENI